MALFQKTKKIPFNRFIKIVLQNNYKGTHDFTTFTFKWWYVFIKMQRHLIESYWKWKKDKWGYQVLTYTICGNAFLYKMVRSLVGTQMVYAIKK